MLESFQSFAEKEILFKTEASLSSVVASWVCFLPREKSQA